MTNERQIGFQLISGRAAVLHEISGLRLEQVAVSLDDGAAKIGLGGKMIVDRRVPDSHRRGNVFETKAVIASALEKHGCSFENMFTG